MLSLLVAFFGLSCNSRPVPCWLGVGSFLNCISDLLFLDVFDAGCGRRVLAVAAPLSERSAFGPAGFFALPGLLLLFKDLLLSLLFFRGLSSLLAHNFYRSSLGRSDLGSCCLWLFSRYFLILLTHTSALII